MGPGIDPFVEKNLNAKNPDLSQVFRRAAQDAALFEEIFGGLEAKNKNYRYNCFKVVHRMGGEHPQAVYPFWGRLIGFLDSDNACHRASAVYLLPRLLAADSRHRFDAVLDRYLAMLGDESIVVSRYVAQNATGIAAFRPDLRDRVVESLLSVPETPHKQGREDLLVSDAIEVLGALYPHPSDPQRERTAALARDYLECSSPRTRRAARSLLRQIETGR